LSGSGAVMRASQVWRMPGLSWVGDPGAVEGGLALAEQEGVALAGGLVRGEPLQRLGASRVR
jgi:hypothetical protein